MKTPKKINCASTQRPILNEVSVPTLAHQPPLPKIFAEPGEPYITCLPGEWDAMLKLAYTAGWTLLEIEQVNGEQKVIRAWKQPIKSKLTQRSRL